MIRRRFTMMKTSAAYRRGVFLAFLVGICGTSCANVLLDESIITTSGEAELSKWYGYRQYDEGPGDLAFSNALLRARTAHVPILTVWSSPECHFCDAFTTMLNTPECQAYVASKKILFTYFKSGNATAYTPPCNPASQDAYLYVHQTGITGYWPHLRLEWRKPDGTTVASSWSFVTNQSDKNHKFTVEEFSQKLESLLVGYDNEGSLEYSGGSVAVSDSAASRLEAEAGITKSVWVPLKRSVYSMEVATNEVVKCVWRETTNEYEVAWAAGDTDKFVEVEIPVAAKEGDRIEILVESLSGQLESTGAIHVVAPQAASQENPLWIGEKTADELAWGEWTMDLDAATQKVAAAVAAGTNAYTLALVGGELWCPDCAGMRTNLLVKAEFLDWAASNHVALVLIDVPRNGSTCPTMLSWDESGSGAAAVSGAAYLSRKGISPVAAKEIYDRDYDLCYSTWNVPYEKRARLWVPTLIVLDSDGKPHGKLLGDRRYPGSSFTVATYMRRFDELLALADDAGEWNNNDWSTTEESFTAQSGTWAGTLGAIDGNTGNAMNQKVIDVAEVTGFAKNCIIEFTVSGDRDAVLRPDVVTVRDGDGEAETTRGAAFSLSEGTTLCVTNHGGGVQMFLSLNGADIDFFSYAREDDSVCRYQVKAEMALLFNEGEESVAVDKGELSLLVEKGEIYRLAGVSVDAPGEAFECLGGGLYRARISGLAKISVLEAGLLSYQLWKPGTVSFAETEVAVGERDGEATLTVCRSGGASGSVGVRVSYSGGTAASIADDIENGRFAWAGDVEFHWPDGVSTNQSFAFPVFDRSPRWDGDQTVVFAVAATEGYAAIGAASNCVVTILEQDRRLPGRLELQMTDAAFSSPGVAYARAGNEVEFAVRRVKGADGDVSASFEVTDGAGSVSPASAIWHHNSSEDPLCRFVLKLDDGLSAGDIVLLKVVPSGAPILNGLDRFMVRVLPPEAPSFAADSVYVDDAVCNVLCETNVAFSTAGYARYEVMRTSGELPPGVSAQIDGTALCIGGSPGRAGVFESNWRVDGIGADGARTQGGTLRVVVSVCSLDALCSSETTESEVFPGVVTTYYSGYVLSGELEGTVRLAARSDGEMRMVVEMADGRHELVSSSWAKADSVSVTAELQGDGMSATVRWIGSLISCVIRYDDGSGFFERKVELFADDILPCNIDTGVYAVDFAPLLVETFGHAYISVRVSRSADGPARTVYSGMLPDGRNFSGTAPLVGDTAEYALLPIIARTASGCFRSLLKIYAEASDERSDGRFWTAYNHSVEDAYSYSCWDMPGDAASTWQMAAGGGFYRAGMDLESICALSDDFADDEAVCYAIDMPWKVLESMYFLPGVDGVEPRFVHVFGGMVRPLPEHGNSAGHSFAFDRDSGVFSGRFTAMSDDNYPVAVQYGGVVLPNWGEACGCGELRPGPFRPFGAGTVYVKGNAGAYGTKVVLTPVHEE